MASLSGSNNAVLVNNCQNLENLRVTFVVTEDLVTLGNTGFSLQLNAYPQTTSTSQGQSLNWFQYIIYVGGPLNNQLGWEIQYWSVGAPSSWPPGYTPTPPNTTPWLPVLPNDYQIQPFGSAPSNQIPAGSVMQIQLTTSSGNVTSAAFSVTDPSGQVSPATFTFPAGALYPIYGFQVDIVGPGGGSSCTFTSPGAGTLTYSVSSGTLAVQDASTACGGLQPSTAESSNVVYGDVTPASGATVSQTVSVGWQPWYLVHNEVKMQPGATVTALWRSNDTHLDLFATGNDGAVWSTYGSRNLHRGQPGARSKCQNGPGAFRA